MKVPLPAQIAEARLHLESLPPGPRRDAMEGVVLTLEFVAAYRDDFYEFMAERSRQPDK